MKVIRFVASAPTGSFVNKKGGGDTRVSLDVPLTEKAAMAELGAYADGDQIFRVTVEIDE